MRLRTKLRALFLTVIAISLLTATLSLYAISRLGVALHASQESVQVELLIRSFRSDFVGETVLGELTGAANRDEDAEAALQVRVAGWEEQIVGLRAGLGGDDELDRFIQHVDAEVRTMLPLVERGRTCAKLGIDEGLRLVEQVLTDKRRGIIRAIDDLLAKQEQRVERATAIATASEKRTKVLIALTSLFLVVAAWTGHYLFKNWFLRPIETLSEATHKIAHGEYDTTIPLAGEHEFGRLARDVEKMSASIEHFQTQLVEKERMAAVGEMTASVAHNVRNPLASIRALAQSCHRDPSLEGPIKAALATVIETVDRADRWLKDLLTALRPVRIASQEEDIVQVVTDIAVGSRVFSERKGIALDLESTDVGPPIPLDRRKFEQALIVLISNAVEASPSDSTVTIRVGLDPSGRERVRIEVEDQGHGMTEETLGKLFTPYFTTKKSGVGLGLCLAQKIIFGHRGTIDVDSAPDRGCRMTIWLPREAPDPDPEGGAPESSKQDPGAASDRARTSREAPSPSRGP